MLDMIKKLSKPKERKSCVCIVPAAGSSSRMKGVCDKVFADIGGIPVIAKTLSALEAASCIDEIIVVTRLDLTEAVRDICSEFGITKVSEITVGGATRAESVLNGTLAAGDRFDLIAIHDAARPFPSAKLIERTVSAAKNYGAAAPAIPVKDTIKSAEGNIVSETLDRSKLFAIQTPQVFDASLIKAALDDAVKSGAPITDDCSAVERLGMRVFLTPGEDFNIKLTTPEDIIFAEAISKARCSECE